MVLSNYFTSSAWRTTHKVLIYITGGAHGVMVIIVGNGHGDMSSNPGQGWLHFT